MLVEEVMTRAVVTVGPDAPLGVAVRRMRDAAVGSLLVVEDDIPVGLLTDRDIVVRVLAESGYHERTPVRRAMSVGLVCCREDQSVDEAARLMAERGVRRLPVLDRQGKLVGVLSQRDLPGHAPARGAYEVVFRKRMTTHYGQRRDVPVRTIYVAACAGIEDAGEAALRRFRAECGQRAWMTQADFFEVVEPAERRRA